MTDIPDATDAALQKAILDGLVVYKVQPILDARTGKLIAGEALARWLSPIEDREEPLTSESHLKKLCLLEWEEPFQSRLLDQKISISAALQSEVQAQTYLNFLPEVLLDDSCWKSIQNIISANSAFFGSVVIEVSEMNLFNHDQEMLDRAAERTMHLQSVAPGLKIVLDDFGTGLNNLNRLRAWNVAGIKLDRGLVVNIGEDPKAQAIVRNLRQMSSDLNIQLIAEGVETETEEATLLELGVYLHQGFLRGAPMTLDELLSSDFPRKTFGDN